ncbi:hypothetical protein PHYC_03672 [Phycisphaerales bacterium]|nr:hypothetical protein PHYC_03672 [Phycisphaerales bacterium]
MRTNLVGLAALIVLGFLGLAGCAAVNKAIDDPARKVTVDVPFKGDAVGVTVVSWSSEGDIADGVGHLANHDYDKAKEAFERALTLTKDADPDTHFGLGVAYEMLENLPKAEEHYKAANLLKPREDRGAAVRRVLIKQGKLKE